MKNYSMPIIAVISALIFVGIAVGISVGMKHIPEVEYVNSSNGKFRTDEKEFGDAEIIYGHMQDGEFVPDHFDEITLFEQLESGGFKVQAESENGVQYTYQTAESDENILEYYETWNEDEFPDKYSGSASLSKCE